MSEPTSTKPYLLRAVYEWCVDNGYAPHISVVVDSRTRVPMEYVRNGEIVLNIGPVAASRLQMGKDRKSTRLNSRSRLHLVCRLLLEKKKKNETLNNHHARRSRPPYEEKLFFATKSAS